VLLHKGMVETTHDQDAFAGRRQAAWGGYFVTLACDEYFIVAYAQSQEVAVLAAAQQVGRKQVALAISVIAFDSPRRGQNAQVYGLLLQLHAAK